jgi:hypothetical protein
MTRKVVNMFFQRIYRDRNLTEKKMDDFSSIFWDAGGEI